MVSDGEERGSECRQGSVMNTAGWGSSMRSQGAPSLQEEALLDFWLEWRASGGVLSTRRRLQILAYFLCQNRTRQSDSQLREMGEQEKLVVGMSVQREVELLMHCV